MARTLSKAVQEQIEWRSATDDRGGSRRGDELLYVGGPKNSNLEFSRIVLHSVLTRLNSHHSKDGLEKVFENCYDNSHWSLDD